MSHLRWPGALLLSSLTIINGSLITRQSPNLDMMTLSTSKRRLSQPGGALIALPFLRPPPMPLSPIWKNHNSSSRPTRATPRLGQSRLCYPSTSILTMPSPTLTSESGMVPPLTLTLFFSPFGTAIYEPNTLLASYPVQCTSQDAPYTLPSFNIDPPAMPFAPVLPNLPRYPGAEPSFMPPHNYEQHENSATHVDEAAAPPISAGSVGQVVAQGQKRKREGEHTTKTRKPRTTSQDKYPELDRLTDCFPADPSRRTNIPRVPRKIAARLSSLPQSFRPPPPLDAAPAPCLPSPNQDYSRTTHPAIHPIAPSQLPSNGGAGLRPNATTLPKALVDHLSLVRIEALLCGPHYRPFPRDTKTVISLYRGPALEARRQREGDSFYGNEFIHPQTGEPFVLRVDSLQDILYDLHQRTVEAGMQWTVGQGHMPPEAGPHIPSIQPSPSYYAALHFSEPQVPGLMPDNPPIFPSRPSLHGMHVPASHSHGSPPISDEPESQGPSSIQHSEPLKSAYLYQELFWRRRRDPTLESTSH
ncbi:hypothetical protein MVEN_02017600 [Mycena venus]|uniref:Uncharacterized protein n=1 Tax=Mycena venus TaxID=2733690 RepID=A0A8H6XC97_9AGAR|nr:hypothetical protein MVEN_02017600 [Mycena venus]